MTWSALGIYLTFITAVAGFVSTNMSTHVNRTLFIIASIVIYLLVTIFINQQLYWKKYELSAMNSINKLLISVANGTKKLNPDDYTIPNNQFLPKIILNEMGWDGTKKFKLKNIGTQKYVTIYANLFITLLTIFLIISLAITYQPTTFFN